MWCGDGDQASGDFRATQVLQEIPGHQTAHGMTYQPKPRVGATLPSLPFMQTGTCKGVQCFGRPAVGSAPVVREFKELSDRVVNRAFECLNQPVIVVNTKPSRDELVVEQIRRDHIVIGFAAAAVEGQVTANPVPDQPGQRAQREVVNRFPSALQPRPTNARNQDDDVVVHESYPCKFRAAVVDHGTTPDAQAVWVRLQLSLEGLAFFEFVHIVCDACPLPLQELGHGLRKLRMCQPMG